MTAFTLYHLWYLLQGAGWTILLSALAMTGGGLLALPLALALISGSRAVRAMAHLYIQVIQGTPLLIVMFIAYFGIGIFGGSVPALVAAGLSLTVYSAAFLAEIWCGALKSVPAAQWEAAKSLGLGRMLTLWLVVLPQAVRISIPPTVGFLVQVIKNTSIASLVGYVELTRAAQIVNNSTFQPFLCFVIVAAIYFAICYPLSRWSRVLERRYLVPA